MLIQIGIHGSNEKRAVLDERVGLLQELLEIRIGGGEQEGRDGGERRLGKVGLGWQFASEGMTWRHIASMYTYGK
jgi:hypothetical protein